MKKIIWFLLILTTLTNIYVFAENEEQPLYYKEGMFIAVYVPDEHFEDFYRFIEMGEPTIYDISSIMYIFECIYDDSGQEVIKETCPEASSRRLYTKGSGGHTWVYQNVAGLCDFETLNYFAHTTNIQELLQKNEIECIVTDYLFVTLSPYLFPFILVNTDQGYYYIMLEKAEENNEWIGYNHFTYHIYDTQEMLATQDIVNEKAKFPPIEIVIDIHRVNFDTPPIIKSDRILVPIRALCERMGANVKWEEDTKTVTVTREEITVVFTVGETVAKVNGEKYELDVAPEIMNDRTLVPLRFVAESLGYYVNWVDDGYVELFSNYNKDTVN